MLRYQWNNVNLFSTERSSSTKATMTQRKTLWLLSTWSSLKSLKHRNGRQYCTVAITYNAVKWNGSGSVNETLTQDLIAVRHVSGSTGAEVAGFEIGGFCPSLSHKHNRPHYCPISGDKSTATVSPSFQETQTTRGGKTLQGGKGQTI